MLEHALKCWAEQNNSTKERAIELYKDGVISKWEVLDAFLMNRGILCQFATLIMILLDEFDKGKGE